ncbi:MAG TPA: DNA primase, partial [Stenotrophomonas sp.]|nr:DNA primase [Stenotrophomonas sp.]
KDALGKDERRMKLLDRAGLFSKNDRGHVYDKFRDRVMFPIFDRRGRVIAYGGRVMEKDDGPKYLNSPETALFHKGRELYGLWQVRQANQKIERLIVVEGYMDVVSLFQFGVTQAVATLGTATTPDHAELLFRNAPDVFFCFDGDAAGRRAGWRALESVLPRMKDGRQAFFLFLPDGEDPDTIVRKEGREGFDARLQQATPLSQFFFDELTREINLGTLDGKARLAERAKPMLAQIPDGAFGDLMKQQLAQLTGLGGTAQATRAPMPQRQPQRTIQPVAKRSLVRGAIAVLLQQPSLALTLGGKHHFQGLRLPGVELLLTGGLLRKQSLSLQGSQAEASLNTYSFDTLFLGVDGLDLQFGLTTHHEAEASLNHRMVERARRIVVLTDASKFGRVSLHRIARLDQVHTIITDASIDSEYLDGLQRLGVEVIIAESPP